MSESAEPEKQISDELRQLLLLPGESLAETGRASGQLLVLTNWRLLVLRQGERPQLEHCTPLCCIDRLQVADVLKLRVHRKFGCAPPPLVFDSLPDITHWADRLDPGKLPGQPAPPAADDCGHSLQDFNDETQRLGLGSGCWRVSDANADWSACGSYPRQHSVPAGVTDAELAESARYRAQGRFPSAVWRCRTNGAVLARSAQPLVGLTGFLGWRCKPDEKLVAGMAADTGSKVLVVDARPYSSALGNGTRGGGYERPEYYANTEIEYLGLPNMHTVRASFSAMLAALQETQSPSSFLVELERSGWPQLLASLLTHSGRIAEALVSDGRSVLVHCSDGWDRTPQLTSLALLLADPHYRTVRGFRQLLQRQWLDFGHKFVDRCANRRRPGCRGNETDANERSPIFLQFLHCVHQLLAQAPQQFQFTDWLLRRLGQHCYSGLFRDFFANSQQQRSPADPGRCLCCLFAHSQAVNRLFVGRTADDADAGAAAGAGDAAALLLRPDTRLGAMRLWRSFYIPTAAASGGGAATAAATVDWDGLPPDVDTRQAKLESLQRQVRQLEQRCQELRRADQLPASESRPERRSSTPVGPGDDEGQSSEADAPSLEVVDKSDAKFTRWVPDRLRSHCSGCSCAFGLVRRRHHCRLCGEVVCASCSDNFLPLIDPHLPDPASPVRVCDSCKGRQAAPGHIPDSRIAVNS